MTLAISVICQSQVQFNFRASNGSFSDPGNSRYTITVTGGTYTGSGSNQYLRLGNDSVNNKISIRRSGNRKIQVAGGYTVTAEVYFENNISQAGQLLLKVGSFSYTLANRKVNIGYVNFPIQTVTASGAQFTYYPVGSEVANGYNDIPTGQWVTLRITYSQAAGYHSTTVDGHKDIERYRARGTELLQQDTGQDFRFLTGVKNVRVRNISFSTGEAPATPLVRVSVQPIQYRDSLMISLDRFSSTVKFPCELRLRFENYNGTQGAFTYYTLTSSARKVVMLLLPATKNTLNSIQVSLQRDKGLIYSEYHTFANPSNSGTSQVNINNDNVFVVGGSTKIFPRMLYHVRNDDFYRLPGLDCNVVHNDFNNNTMGGSPIVNTERALDSATKYGVKVVVAANTDWGKTGYLPYTTYSSLLGFYVADEPYGMNLLERKKIDYFATKQIIKTKSMPLLSVQNNGNRFVDLASGVDWLGSDPYPTPNISNEYVYDFTKQCVYAVAGKKPVITMLNQYDKKKPTLSELRNMAWAAVTGGATGVGIFEFDHRFGGNTWYTPDSTNYLAAIDTVFGELKKHEAKLTSSLNATQVTETNKFVHCLIRTNGSQKYLFVVNVDRASQSCTIVIPGARSSLVPLNRNGASATKSGSTWTIILSGLQYSIFQY